MGSPFSEVHDDGGAERMELQGAQVILTGLGGCALLIFSLSMFFCCVQRWISLLHYHEMSRSPSSQELLFKENEVVQFEVAKPTLIYCTKDIPYQKNQKSSRSPLDLNEMEEEVFINESKQQRSKRSKWKIWKSWESKIQNIIIPVQSQTETQL